MTRNDFTARYASGEDNNFNLLRMLAALAVLVSHSFALAYGSSDREPLVSIIGFSLGAIGVDIFFIVSGFLVSASFLRRRSIRVFLYARFLRVYPALVVCVFSVTVLVGAAFSSYAFSEYLSNEETLQYLFKNSVLLLGVEHTLPGVFNDLPFKYAVNSSLWTLPYEIYLYLGLAALFGLLNKLGLLERSRLVKLLVSTLFCVTFFLNMFRPFESFLVTQAIRFGSLFLSGVLMYLHRDTVVVGPASIFTAGLAMLFMPAEAFYFLYSLLLPFLVFYVAYVPSRYLHRYNKLGDLSYGLYIYAFPIQQATLAIMPDVSLLYMILLSAAITLTVASFSWHFIEAKCLSLKAFPGWKAIV